MQGGMHNLDTLDTLLWNGPEQILPVCDHLLPAGGWRLEGNVLSLADDFYHALIHQLELDGAPYVEVHIGNN